MLVLSPKCPRVSIQTGSQSCIDVEAAYAHLSWFSLAGKLIEYNKPSKLLETNSSFTKLVAEYWSSCRRNSYQDFNKYQ